MIVNKYVYACNITMVSPMPNVITPASDVSVLLLKQYINYMISCHTNKISKLTTRKIFSLPLKPDWSGTTN
jgi:hypothetical protein